MREKISKAKPFADVAAHQIEKVFTMTDKTDRSVAGMEIVHCVHTTYINTY